MSSFSAENRRTFRMPLSGDRQEGELRFENDRYEVRLIDESAGGFCALCERLPNVNVGTKGLLLAGDDWFEVSVTNLRPVKPTPTDSNAAASSPPETLPYPSKTCYRIGLRRLSDAFDHSRSPGSHSWAGLFCRLRHANPNTMGMFAAGAVLALVVAFFPFFALRMASSDKPKEHKEETQRPKLAKRAENVALGDNALSNALAATAADLSSEPSKSAKTGRPTELPGIPKLDRKIAELQRTIQDLPGALPFALPEVVEQLNLTESQRKRIRELLGSAAETIAAKANDLGNAAAAKNAILNDALKSVLDLLDDDQREKWRELKGEPEKNPAKNDKSTRKGT